MHNQNIAEVFENARDTVTGGEINVRVLEDGTIIGVTQGRRFVIGKLHTDENTGKVIMTRIVDSRKHFLKMLKAWCLNYDVLRTLAALDADVVLFVSDKRKAYTCSAASALAVGRLVTFPKQELQIAVPKSLWKEVHYDKRRKV